MNAAEIVTESDLALFAFNPKTGELPSCQTCHSQAYYYALVKGADLYYCGHHANKYEVSLMQAASKTVDIRYKLDDK
jgi:hypothetical protein